MTRIRDIVFDLGGVLIDWNPRHLFITHLGYDVDEVEAFLAGVCTPQWHANLDSGLSFDAAAEQLIEDFPRYARWIRSYVADWEQMFAGPISATVEQLDRCHDLGYRVHALSNYPAEQIAFLYRTYPFMRHFHTVVVSGLLGMTKPGPEIFRYLADRLNHKQCLYIDDRSENVLAARAVGMHAIEFDVTDGPRRLAAVIEAEQQEAGRDSS